MATKDDTKPFDGLADLVAAYEALGLLAFNQEGHSSPTWVLLDNLNRQLRAFIDSADQRGLLS
jgi:hypothetical protein